jgi:hypothetical protein
MSMSFMLSPGVTVREYDLTNIIPQVATSGSAIVGPFTWGEVDKVKILSNEDDLVHNFGIPDGNTFTNWFCAKNFLDYSRNLKAVRVINTNPSTGSKNADSEGAGILIKNHSDWQDNFSNGEAAYATHGAFAAKYPGNLGNSVAVHIADADTYSAVLTAKITNPGSGYKTANDHARPVTFAAPTDPNGIAATGTLNVVADVVTGITIVTPGKGYRNPPSAVIPGPLDVTANATMNVVGDVLIGITVTDGGYGYSGNEVITFPAPTGGGTRAIGTLVLTNGRVSGVSFVTPGSTAGSGYKTADDHGDAVVIGGPSIGGVTATGQGVMWEYYNQFLTAPNTSDYAAARSCSNDEMHMVIVDELGLFSGIKGKILERFPFVSKALDVLNEDGTSGYYKYVLRDRSNYAWCINHPEDDIDNAGTSNWGQRVDQGTIVFD